MKFRVCAIAAVFALAACDPAAQKPAEPAKPGPIAAKLDPLPAPPAPDGCGMRTQAPWTRAGAGWQVVGDASGADCAAANVTIYVVDPAGGVAHTRTFESQNLSAVFGEAAEHPVKDRAGMTKALSAWIAPNDDALFDFTGRLPPWATAREFPAAAGGDFAFLPEDGTSRSDYEKLRAANLPLFCYVQGMESMRCLVVENNQLRSIGVQTFPG